MTDTEEDLLQLSGLQHFAFCRRQWALIHVEHQWQENLRTVEGALFHQRAHDEAQRERRGDTLILRGLPVISHRLGITGQCDVVEFHGAPDGVPLRGEDGLWLPYPIEYKRGAPKAHDADRLQLCAQAMCLEEMHQLYRRGHTPKVRPAKSCSACSLKELCLPILRRRSTVADYLARAMEDTP